MASDEGRRSDPAAVCPEGIPATRFLDGGVTLLCEALVFIAFSRELD